MVNGKVVTTLGTKVNDAKDKVQFAGKEVGEKAKNVYILLNKPVRLCDNSKR